MTIAQVIFSFFDVSGFLIYFFYGMKESSEEYSRRGLAPPTANAKSDAPNKTGHVNQIVSGSPRNGGDRYGTPGHVDDTSRLVENEDYDSSCEQDS
jgi:hypothetical protein